MNGKISKNFYRMPYGDQEQVIMLQDYFTHGGSMDSRSQTGLHIIVAPADGTICQVRDELNDCGCAGSTHPIGACGNKIAIQHANGEVSAYLHLMQFSIRNTFGVSDPQVLIGTFVSQGQMVGIEGDVGRTCGNDGPPRWGSCVTEEQAEDLTNCFRHAHWNVRDITTGEFLLPMTCGITNHMYADNGTYTAVQCEDAGGCISGPATLPPMVLSNSGTAQVIQGDSTLTANLFVVQDSAAAVIRSESRVRLLPGVHVGQGSAYFRVEIGPCNQTALNP
jgi:hypothetical protein